jgi:hypothetical protein
LYSGEAKRKQSASRTLSRNAWTAAGNTSLPVFSRSVLRSGRSEISTWSICSPGMDSSHSFAAFALAHQQNEHLSFRIC